MSAESGVDLSGITYVFATAALGIGVMYFDKYFLKLRKAVKKVENIENSIQNALQAYAANHSGKDISIFISNCHKDGLSKLLMPPGKSSIIKRISVIFFISSFLSLLMGLIAPFNFPIISVLGNNFMSIFIYVSGITMIFSFGFGYWLVSLELEFLTTVNDLRNQWVKNNSKKMIIKDI